MCGIHFSHTTWVKTTLVNLGAVLFALGIFEPYLWTQQFDKTQVKISESPKVKIRHNVLGYAARGPNIQSATASYGDEVLYDVEYTFTPTGWRRGFVSETEHSNPQCLLFFGGSYAFGHGLHDKETLPYLVGKAMGGKVQTYNFSLSGYGPHQMLALLEDRLEIDVLKQCQAIMAIYFSIPDHINRVVGQTNWDTHGPRYILDEKNKLRRSGHFDDSKKIHACTKKAYWLDKVINQLEKSFIYQSLSTWNTKVDECQLKLFLSIIKRAKNIFEERYPKSKFHTLFWDNKSSDSELILDYFRRNNFLVHLVSKILPNFHTDGNQYRIHPLYEHHPSSLTTQLLAQYVVNLATYSDTGS